MLDMTKRRLLRWSLLLVLLAVFAVWLEPTRVVWGWLRGEAFYQGRPTSWWDGELASYKMDLYFLGYDFPGAPHSKEQQAELEAHGRASFSRRSLPWTRKWWAWIASAKADKVSVPALLKGDTADKAVKDALHAHLSPDVAQMTRFGLRRIAERTRDWKE